MTAREGAERRRDHCRLCHGALELTGGEWVDVRTGLAVCPPVGYNGPLVPHQPYPPGDAPLAAQIRAIVAEHQDRAWSAGSREGTGQPHPPLDNEAILRTARYAFEHLPYPEQLDRLDPDRRSDHDTLITELVVIYDAFRDDAAERQQ